MGWKKLLIVFSALIYATSATYYYRPGPSYQPGGIKETVKPVTEDIRETDEDSGEAHSLSVESYKEPDFANEEEPSFYYRPYFVPYKEVVKEQSTPISTVAQPAHPAKQPAAEQEGHSGHNVNTHFGHQHTHPEAEQEGHSGHNVNTHFGHQHTHPAGNVMLAGSIATNLGSQSSTHQLARPYSPHGYGAEIPVHGGGVPYGQVNPHYPGSFAAAGAIATNFRQPSFHYAPGSFAPHGPVYHRPSYHVPNYHLPQSYHGGYRTQDGGYHPVYYGHRDMERADLEPVFVFSGFPHVHASGSVNLNGAGANVMGGLITSPGQPITLSVPTKPQEEEGVRGPHEQNDDVQLINEPFEVLGTIPQPPTTEAVRHPEKPVVHLPGEPTVVHHGKLPAHSELPYPNLFYPPGQQNLYYYYTNPYAYHPDKDIEDAVPAASEQAVTTIATAAVAAPATAVKKPGAPKKNSSSQAGKDIPIEAVEVTAHSGVEKPEFAGGVVDARSGNDQDLTGVSDRASAEAPTPAAPAAEEKKEAASSRVVDLTDAPFAAFGPVADKDDGRRSSQEFVDNDKTVAILGLENGNILGLENGGNTVNVEEPVTKSN